MGGSKFAGLLQLMLLLRPPTQRTLRDETYISTQRAETQAHTRIPRPHENQGWPPHNCCAPRQGPSPSGRLNLASARCGLPRSHRILKPADFTAVLRSGRRWRNDCFSVCAVANPYPHGRIGIVVSRKTSPRAVVRNHIKRQIRESFRQCQEKLCGLDIVVVASPRSGRTQPDSLRLSLQQLWEKVEQKCRKS